MYAGTPGKDGMSDIAHADVVEDKASKLHRPLSPQDEQGLGAEKCYAFKGRKCDGDGSPETGFGGYGIH